jgi:hypothetical protein
MTNVAPAVEHHVRGMMALPQLQHALLRSSARSERLSISLARELAVLTSSFLMSSEVAWRSAAAAGARAGGGGFSRSMLMTTLKKAAAARRCTSDALACCSSCSSTPFLRTSSDCEPSLLKANVARRLRQRCASCVSTSLDGCE